MTRSPGATGATVTAVATTAVTVLPVFLLGGLAVQIDAEIGLPDAVLGLLAASYWAASALVSTRAGLLAVRLGSQRGMLLAVALAGASGLGAALWSPHWGWLLGWGIVAGVANGLGHPPSNALISQAVPATGRGLAFGVKQAAIPAGTLLSGLAVPLLALPLGWRAGFAALAIVAAVTAVLVVLVVPAERRDPVVERPRAVRLAEAASPELRRFLALASWASFFGAAQANVIGTFTVSSAHSVGIAATTAAGILSLGSVAGLISRPLVGYLADRRLGGTMLTVALMMSAGLLGLAGMAVGLAPTFLLGCILGFGLGWGWNGLVHYAVSRRSGALTAQATGVVQRGAYAGSAAGPLGFGLLLGAAGSTASWIAAMGVAAVAVTLALLAWRAELRLPAND